MPTPHEAINLRGRGHEGKLHAISVTSHQHAMSYTDRSERITFSENLPGLISARGMILNMEKAEQDPDIAVAAPKGHPERMELLRTMLTATGRGGVPVRRAFVQALEPDEEGSRRGPMASLISDPATLDVYLLIHALASSRVPYDARYQSAAWAIMAGFTINSELTGAKSRWSRAITKLSKLGLIRREGAGRSVRYFLLHESGNGDPYTRPKTVDDGRWFTVPYTYWLDGWDQKLGAAEKLVLMVALSSKRDFELPYYRAAAWYGISESSAKRGLTRLAGRQPPVLMRYERWVPDAASPTLWRTIITYRLLGKWSAKSRSAVMRKSRATGAVKFDASPDETSEDESVLSGSRPVGTGEASFAERVQRLQDAKGE